MDFPARTTLFSLFHLSPENKWRIGMILGALLWAGMVLYGQEVSSFEYFSIPERFLMRFGLNLLFLYGIVLLSSKWLNLFFMTVSAIILSGLAMYARYFDHSISAFTLLHNTGEGLAVRDAIIPLINWPEVCCFALVVILAARIFVWAGNRRVPYIQRFGWAAVFLCCYFGIIFGVQYWNPSRGLFILRCEEYRHKLIGCYGYTPVLFCELLMKNQKKLVERAVEAHAERSISLDQYLQKPNVKRIVVVQVESLGRNTLHAQYEGKNLLPFLSNFADKNGCMAVNSFHINGSADADFSFLAAKAPSPDMANYRIEGFPYDNTLIHTLKQNGFYTQTIHGNYKDFYNREYAFEQMEIDKSWFMEELKDYYGQCDSKNHILDEKVFNFCLDQICQETHPKNYYHIITMSSHTPFNYVDDFHGLTYEEKYIKSFQYVDKCLSDFIQSLPPDTFLILYGDHAPELCSNGRTLHNLENFDDSDKAVPGIICLIGENSRFCLPSPLANSMDASLVDLASYVKQVSAQTSGPRPGDVSVPQMADAQRRNTARALR